MFGALQSCHKKKLAVYVNTNETQTAKTQGSNVMAATILTETMTDQDRSKAITFAIKDADRDMRRRYPILNHQDALGAGFFLACTCTVIVTSVLFIQGVVPWWVCILVNAFCMSLLREI